MSSTPVRPIGPRLGFGVRRDPDQNFRTAFVPLHLVAPLTVFEAVFAFHYDTIRRLVGVGADGVGVLAVRLSNGRMEGWSWVAAEEGRPSALTIGRHSSCDLVLTDPSVSLRQLVAVVPRAGTEPRYSLHALRPSQAFYTGLGQELGAAHVERAGFFRVGPYALLTFFTGPSNEWLNELPDDPAEAWQSCEGAVRAIAKPEPRVRNEGSQVSCHPAPLFTAERLLEPGETPEATLLLSARRKRGLLPIGGSALERGALLGRYDRCHLTLRDAEISRVHVMVIRLGGEILVVDLASTNGLHRGGDGDSTSVVVLSEGEEATLAENAVTLSLESEHEGTFIRTRPR